MENKYFQPEISDIRVGYEFEARSDSYRFQGSEEWEKEIITNKNIELYCNIANLQGEIRTPYLTKEQIEAEGWRDFEHTREVWLVRNNWVCVLYSDGIRLTYVGDTRYNGKCVSINEFRYICKLLGINEEK